MVLNLSNVPCPSIGWSLKSVAVNNTVQVRNYKDICVM